MLFSRSFYKIDLQRYELYRPNQIPICGDEPVHLPHFQYFSVVFGYCLLPFFRIARLGDAVRNAIRVPVRDEVNWKFFSANILLFLI